MTEPLVSIIIPLYNASSFIEKCLESAINQTWTQKEVIVIDDGSIDNSYELAKAYENEWVHIYQQENKGASAARNQGLSLAKGKYIQFLDADDFLSLDKIEHQVALLEKSPGCISHCETIYFKNDTGIEVRDSLDKWYTNPTNQSLEFVLRLLGGVSPDNKGAMIQPNAWLTPRTLINNAGPWNEQLSVDDDGEFFLRVILQSRGICYAEKGTNHYRKHTKNSTYVNLSGQLTEAGFRSRLNAIDLKYQHLKSIVAIEHLNKIAFSHYAEIAIAAYPKYKQVSALAQQKATWLGIQKIKYSGGPLSNILSSFIHWKILRYANFVRYGY